jgi:hypothetical protein
MAFVHSTPIGPRSGDRRDGSVLSGREPGEEFTDISYRALAELGLEANTASELAARAQENEGLLLERGGVLGQYRVPNLEAALNVAVGHPWRKAWNQAPAKR